MHNSIETISAECFEGCTALQSVSWPENLKTIEHDAFSGCTSLTGVPTGTKLQTLGDNAFKNCTSLTYADFPTTLTKIGQGAFAGCTKLQEIVLPDSITEMGNRAFEGCSSAKKLTLSKGLKIINNYCFSGCSSIADITVPDNITEIGREAFYNCSGANVIRLPKTLVQIGNDAFTGRNANSVIRWDECQAPADVYLGTNALGTGGYILAPIGSAAAAYCKTHGATLITTLVRDFVERCYKKILDRTADEGGLLDWCKKIASGKETGASIVKNFVDSNEFVKKNYSNEQKLEILYETMMGRPSDTNGKKFWLDYMNIGFTTDFVINGFASSTTPPKSSLTSKMLSSGNASSLKIVFISLSESGESK